MKRFQAKVLLPIVFKLVFLTSALIISVALIIAWKNSELFKQISTDREESTAEILTSSKSMETEAILESYADKLNLIASNNDHSKALSGDLLFFRLDSIHPSAGFESQGSLPAGIEASQFQSLLDSYKEQSSKIQSGSVFITSSGPTLKEPFLIMASPVAKENGSVSHWAWGVFRLNKLQASFEQTKNHHVYLIDETGRILIHPDEKETFKATDLSSKKIIKLVLKDDLRKRQQYADQTLYSTSRTIYGPMVIGEVAESSILAPAKLAKETIYFILGIVLSLSFLLTVIFSQRLSHNLEKLTVFAHRIAQGDFNFYAALEIKSKDEIGLLAHAFDDMTIGLRERDKIKNMFTKFHGTAITDELMNQEDMRKGNQCEAVIFFSDIRGFTDFSNSRTPEEIVKMLNSYFEVMVGIINRHGGVVDKFVGDAIMAVWGAPHGTPEDSKKAVQACLEMRLALVKFNEDRIANGEVPIKMGMGLHAGPVIAGTVGSTERLEYTVIGDTVNTASRIESSTKSFGTDLLISEEVARRIGEQFLINFAGSTKVKGKDAPLRLAQVSGYYDEDFNPVIIATPYSSYEAEDSEKVKIVA